MQSEVIAFANQKGGVGKSTDVLNLAAIKASQGKRVLMIDLDPNPSLTTLCGMEPYPSPNVSHLLCGENHLFECGYPVEKSGLDTLFLVPSDTKLAETKDTLIPKIGREQILKNAIDPFKSEFDYIFIDCPPELGVLTLIALTAADKVVIPTEAEYTTFRRVLDLHNTIETIKKAYNNELSFIGYIINSFEIRVNDQKDMLAEYEKKGKVLGTVRKTANVYKNVNKGLPVSLAIPKCNVSEDYRKIARKIK